jgi:hypothetical protein
VTAAEDTAPAWTARELFTGAAFRGITGAAIAANPPSYRGVMPLAERLRFLEEAAVDLAEAARLLPAARAEVTDAWRRGEPGAEERLAELEHTARAVATVTERLPGLRAWLARATG